MAADDARIRMDGDTTPARAALMQIVATMRQMENAMTRMAATSQRSSRRTTQELTGMRAAALGAVKGLAGFFGIAGGLAAANRAASLFRNELEAIRRIDMSAAEQALQTGNALKMMRMTLGTTSGINYDDIRRRAADASGGNLTPADIITASKNAVSAGAKPELRATRAEIPIRLAELGGEALGAKDFAELSASLGTLSDKVENFNIDEAITVALQAASFSPSSDMRLFSKNILRGAVPQLLNEGFNFTEAVQMASAGQVVTQDSEGARIRTSVPKQFQQLRQAAQVFGVDKQGMDLVNFIQGDTDEAKKVRMELLRIQNIEAAALAKRYREAESIGDTATMQEIDIESAGTASALAALMSKEKFEQLKTRIEGESSEKRIAVDLFQASTTRLQKGGMREVLGDAQSVIRGGPEAVAEVQAIAEQNRTSRGTRETAVNESFTRGINILRDADRSGAFRAIVLTKLRELKEATREGTEVERNISGLVNQVNLMDAGESEILDFAAQGVGGIVDKMTNEDVFVQPGGVQTGRMSGGFARRRRTEFTPEEARIITALQAIADGLQAQAEAAKAEEAAVVNVLLEQTEIMKKDGTNRPPNYKPVQAAMPSASSTSAE